MRLIRMMSRTALLAALVALALSACSRSDPAPEATDVPSERALSVGTEPAPGLVPAMSSPVAPPVQTLAKPAPPSASRDPQVVAQAWADAVERSDWATVRGYWGDYGARSGLNGAQFAAQWGTLARPVVVIGQGSQEGAAGSLYYTAPVTIADGARRISGEVVFRRVNDVDGASPEQLRWHIESTTLKP